MDRESVDLNSYLFAEKVSPSLITPSLFVDDYRNIYLANFATVLNYTADATKFQQVR